MKIVINKGLKIIDDSGAELFSVPVDKAISLVNKDNKSPYYRKFKATCEFMGVSEELIVLQLREAYISSLPKYEEPELEVEEEYELDITTWQEVREVINKNLLNREEAFLILLSTVAAIKSKIDESLFMVLWGPKTAGKSTMLNAFEGSGITHHTDDVTLNGFAPGVASADAERPEGLLDRCKNKTLIMEDLTAILNQQEEKVNKFISIMEKAFGAAPYRKDSLQHINYGGQQHMIFGVPTVLMFNKKADFARSKRYLYYKIPEVDDWEIEERGMMSDKHELRAAVLSFVKSLDLESVDDITIDADAYSRLINFLDVFKHYMITFGKSGEKPVYHDSYDLGNWQRHKKIMIKFLKGQALVLGKKSVDVDMVNQNLKLFVMSDTKLQYLEKLEVLSSLKTVVDPRDFEDIF